MADGRSRLDHMANTETTSLAVTSVLRGRQEIAEGTMAFRFEKPPGWLFKAGQFLDMTLVNPLETDAEGNTRTFSIASGRHEGTLMIGGRKTRPFWRNCRRSKKRIRVIR
jgi:NAD(P)H-flavin reductase